jgi:hypothetical protein
VFVLAQWTQFWVLVIVFAADRIAAAGAGDLSRADVTILAGGTAPLAAATMLTRHQRTAEHIAALLRFPLRQRHKSRAELRAAGASWHHDIQRLGLPRNLAAIAALAMRAGPATPPVSSMA